MLKYTWKVEGYKGWRRKCEGVRVSQRGGTGYDRQTLSASLGSGENRWCYGISMVLQRLPSTNVHLSGQLAVKAASACREEPHSRTFKAINNTVNLQAFFSIEFNRLHFRGGRYQISVKSVQYSTLVMNNGDFSSLVAYKFCTYLIIVYGCLIISFSTVYYVKKCIEVLQFLAAIASLMLHQMA